MLFILEGRYKQLESVLLGSPLVGDVAQSHVVRLGVYSAYVGQGVSTGEVSLVGAHSIGPVVDEQVVVAVQLEALEPQHEPLEDGVRLEGDGALQVPLAPGSEHGALDHAVVLLQEGVVAQLRHRVEIVAIGRGERYPGGDEQDGQVEPQPRQSPSSDGVLLHLEVTAVFPIPRSH